MKNKILILVLSFTFVFTCCLKNAFVAATGDNFLPVYPNFSDIDTSNDILIEIIISSSSVRKYLISNIQGENDVSITFSFDTDLNKNKMLIKKNNNNVVVEQFTSDIFSSELRANTIENDELYYYFFDNTKILVSSNLYNVVNISELNPNLSFSFYDINETTTNLTTSIVDTTVDNTTDTTTVYNPINNDTDNNFTRLEHIIIFFGLLFFTMSFVNLKSKGSVIDV